MGFGVLTKVFCIVISFLFIISVCGCSIVEDGYSLQAFTERANERFEQWEISANGFILNEKDKTYSKFFKFDKNEILVQFEYNENKELTSLHIVFDKLTKNNTQELDFIKNIIFAFINNNTITTEILSEINFEKAIFTPDLNTKTTKNGNIELKIDVTEIGTVISVYQNIP